MLSSSRDISLEPTVTVCGFSFRGSDGLQHICDLNRSMITGQHEPSRTHLCKVHGVEEA